MGASGLHSPPGAEISVDGIPTGKQTLCTRRITLASTRSVLKKDGFQLSRRPVELTEGGTVSVNEKMRPISFRKAVLELPSL